MRLSVRIAGLCLIAATAAAPVAATAESNTLDRIAKAGVVRIAVPDPVLVHETPLASAPSA